MQDDLGLLDMMVDDLARQTDVYRPGPYWQGYAARMTSAIRAHGLSAFRRNPAIGRGFADVFASEDTWARTSLWSRDPWRALAGVPGIRTLKSLQFRRWQRRERRQFDERAARFETELGPWLDAFAASHGLPDTCVGKPERRLRLAGREIGEIYLRTFAWQQDISALAALDRVRTVFEIGGGFGAMCHSLLHFNPGIRKYVYLDIPPVLYVGTQYLKHFFGDALRDYSTTRGLGSIRFADDDRLEILAIAPWQIERLDVQSDLFWNSSSFQEMPGEVVDNYVRHVARTLHWRARVLVYHYEDPRGPGHTLSREEVASRVSAGTGRSMEQVPAPTAGRILPGCLLANLTDPSAGVR